MARPRASVAAWASNGVFMIWGKIRGLRRSLPPQAASSVNSPQALDKPRFDKSPACKGGNGRPARFFIGNPARLAAPPLPPPGNFFQNILAKASLLRFLSARTATNDPFVYRLGLQIFILARRVRLPYGSPFSNIMTSALRGGFLFPAASTTAFPPHPTPHPTPPHDRQSRKIRVPATLLLVSAGMPH